MIRYCGANRTSVVVVVYRAEYLRGAAATLMHLYVYHDNNYCTVAIYCYGECCYILLWRLLLSTIMETGECCCQPVYIYLQAAMESVAIYYFGECCYLLLCFSVLLSHSASNCWHSYSFTLEL